jgi:hypothetical protein
VKAYVVSHDVLVKASGCRHRQRLAGESKYSQRLCFWLLAHFKGRCDRSIQFANRSQHTKDVAMNKDLSSNAMDKLKFLKSKSGLQ